MPIKRLIDIPPGQRNGVVCATPTRYIEQVALTTALSVSDEEAIAAIDRELADLKVLILARRDQEKKRWQRMQAARLKTGF